MDITWFEDTKAKKKVITIYANCIQLTEEIFRLYQGKEVVFGINKETNSLVIQEKKDAEGKGFKISPKTLKINSVSLVKFITDKGYKTGKIQYEIKENQVLVSFES